MSARAEQIPLEERARLRETMKILLAAYKKGWKAYCKKKAELFPNAPLPDPNYFDKK
jgi:hypothetical protein